jgi:flagellar biosynthesis protein FliP
MKKLFSPKNLATMALLSSGALGLFFFVLILAHPRPACAAAEPANPFGGFSMPKVEFEFEKMPNEFSSVLQMMMYLTCMSMIPYVIVCTTAFIRISIIFSFLKTSLGSSHAPSSQVWAALAVIITMFIMVPVYQKIEEDAVKPFKAKKIKYTEFITKVQKPIINFMKVNTRTKDLKLFIMVSKMKNQQKLFENPPIYIMIPAFIASELKTGFFVGFVMYLPFLCIDMITAAVLMSMGMFMLSPMGISLPCKLLMFVMIDGWELLIAGLVKSFRY